MDRLIQDLRYGVRALLKNRGFTLVALLALALGIGANTAIFSVVNAVLLRPLPYHDADRIMTVLYEGRIPVAPAEYLDWREQSEVFEHVAAAQYWQPSLTGEDRPEQLWALHLSADMFNLLGVNPSAGRTFHSDEDQPGSEHVVVLSHRLWQRKFGGDPTIVGRAITLDGASYEVIGIMPPEFSFAPFWATRAELWAPLNLAPRMNDRGGSSLRVFARLKPGVTREQAQAEMAAINQRLEQQYPDSKKNFSLSVAPLHEAVVGNVRPALLVLLGAVSFVLLIACANVASLLMARATVRQKEIAIRTALGASRGRLIRQLLTESMLLALAGGALGLLLAVWGKDLLVAFVGDQIPSYIKPDIDTRVLGFTLLVSLLTGIVFGLVPALQASKLGLNELLKEGSRGSTGGASRHRIRRVLVITEVALALMLLIGAGLMLRSFERLQAFNPGFEVDKVLTVRMNLPRSYTPEQAQAFQQQQVERTGGLPGAKSVGLSSDVPLDGNSSATMVPIEGLAPPDDDIRVYRHTVSPNFFATMGIPLLAGRDFSTHDNNQAPRAVIISESMARRLWPGQDPTGKRISTSRDKNRNRVWDQIVGVAGDVKFRTLIRDQNNDPDIYLPWLQNPDRAFAIVLRAAGDPSGLISAIRGEVHSLDPNLPVFGIATMQERMKNSTARAR